MQFKQAAYSICCEDRVLASTQDCSVLPISSGFRDKLWRERFIKVEMACLCYEWVFRSHTDPPRCTHIHSQDTWPTQHQNWWSWITRSHSWQSHTCPNRRNLWWDSSHCSHSSSHIHIEQALLSSGYVTWMTIRQPGSIPEPHVASPCRCGLNCLWSKVPVNLTVNSFLFPNASLCFYLNIYIRYFQILVFCL